MAKFNLVKALDMAGNMNKGAKRAELLKRIAKHLGLSQDGGQEQVEERIVKYLSTEVKVYPATGLPLGTEVPTHEIVSQELKPNMPAEITPIEFNPKPREEDEMSKKPVEELLVTDTQKTEDLETPKVEIKPMEPNPQVHAQLVYALRHAAEAASMAEQILGSNNKATVTAKWAYAAIRKEERQMAKKTSQEPEPDHKPTKLQVPPIPKVVNYKLPEHQPAPESNGLIRTPIGHGDYEVAPAPKPKKKPGLFGRVFGWISGSNGTEIKVVKKEVKVTASNGVVLNVVKRGDTTTPKTTSTQRTATSSGGWYGHSPCAVARWCGASGWSTAQVKKAFSALGIACADTTISIQTNAGKKGERGEPANLSEELIAKLESAK